jgi:hypothetical protein
VEIAATAVSLIEIGFVILANALAPIRYANYELLGASEPSPSGMLRVGGCP